MLKGRQRRLNELFCDSMEVGDLDIVKKLLKKGADINSVRPDGLSALRLAYSNKQNELVKFLVENGADVNLQDLHGRTVLTDTADKLDVEMGKYFCEHGSIVDLQDKYGETALITALRHSNPFEYAQMLVENGKKTILTDQSKERKDRYYIFINGKEGNQSPLTLAASFGCTMFDKGEKNVKTMNLLVENGADVNRKDRFGNTTLMCLCKGGYIGDNSEYLLRNGADEYIVNNENKTCFDICHFDRIGKLLAQVEKIRTEEMDKGREK